MDIKSLYEQFLLHPRVSTDTRSIHPDSLFFALKGQNFNGNAFAEEALSKGAALAIIDEAGFKKDERFILVKDVLNCLQELAKFHRKRLRIPVIGVTGSNGKTTTKELINIVLSEKYHTYATRGNLNNHIGVPLSILEINKAIEIAIIEMGANHVGEIAQLCSIAAPDYGLVTNIGKAHLEGFGGMEGVMKGKGELYDWLRDHGGQVFLHGDDPVLLNMVSARNISPINTYGCSKNQTVWGNTIQNDPFLNVEWNYKDDSYFVKTQITGRYNLENILAAICIGSFFQVRPESINDGIASYTPSNSRSQIIKTDKNTVICDFYNANASSMSAAIKNLSALSAESKVIILGDMLELGSSSQSEHLEIIKKTLHTRTSRSILVGPKFYELNGISEHGIEFYETTQEAIEAICQSPIKNALILLKASRGMAFEKLIPFL